jgi:hypothetical protein
MISLITALLAQVSPVTTVPPMRPFNLAASEICEGSAGPIDMARVMFLENRTLDFDGATGPLQLRLDGETFYSEEVGEHSGHRTYFNRIDALVQSGEDIDIDLKLALLNGRLVLYWRETYQHRFWRYGLVSIEGRALFGDDAVAMRPLCNGRGGDSSVD